MGLSKTVLITVGGISLLVGENSTMVDIVDDLVEKSRIEAEKMAYEIKQIAYEIKQIAYEEMYLHFKNDECRTSNFNILSRREKFKVKPKHMQFRNTRLLRFVSRRNR